MASTEQTTAKLPPLHLPDPRIADPGKVRVGDSGITGQFPPLRLPLRLPDPRIADPGKVRVGDSGITGQFPLKR
jgi:hypothetical protein